MKIVWIVLALLVAGILLTTWVVFTGRIDIAASSAKGGLLDRLLEETQEHSVKTHAARVAIPDLANASVPLGAAHFREMCMTCHGGPGVSRSEIGQGLNPTPPDLVESARELEPREVYWILKNGIRMTGMPAFGATHNERALAAMTAFVLRLPGMSPEEFRTLADAGEPSGEEEGAGSNSSSPDVSPGETEGR